MDNIIVPINGTYTGETLEAINGQLGKNEPATWTEDSSASYLEKAKASHLFDRRNDDSAKSSIKITVPVKDVDGNIVGQSAAIVQMIVSPLASLSDKERLVAIALAMLQDAAVQNGLVKGRPLQSAPYAV